MNDLIINGIDHSKFDLEWAKRGGVIFDAVYEQIYIFVNKIDEEQIRLVYSSRLRGEIDFLSKSLISSLRMATPAECAEAGVEYIEPPARWLPIESAPKDGTFFDVWNQRFKVRECNVRYVACGFYVGEMRISSGATHWMSQPQPPKDE